MVRQRIHRQVEKKRRGKLTPLPKRFRPLLIVIAIAVALIVYLKKQSTNEIVDNTSPQESNLEAQ